MTLKIPDDHSTHLPLHHTHGRQVTTATVTSDTPTVVTASIDNTSLMGTNVALLPHGYGKAKVTLTDGEHTEEHEIEVMAPADPGATDEGHATVNTEAMPFHVKLPETPVAMMRQRAAAAKAAAEGVADGAGSAEPAPTNEPPAPAPGEAPAAL